jgi:hypothetical protein
LDITYCSERCPIGTKARDNFINLNNSSIDAAIDFGFFVKKCLKNCQYQKIINNVKEPKDENYSR